MQWIPIWAKQRILEHGFAWAITIVQRYEINELCKDRSTNPFTNPNLYLGNEAKAEEY